MLPIQTPVKPVMIRAMNVRRMINGHTTTTYIQIDYTLPPDTIATSQLMSSDIYKSLNRFNICQEEHVLCI